MKIPKQKIQQHFSLKSNRAVDVIFSQNKMDYIHDYYASLQQNKKNNTIALKQTLQNNYQNMLYCTQLLEKVKKYGNAVSELAKQIENEMELSTISSANAHKPTKQKNQVIRIEKLIKNYKFSQAMNLSYNSQAIKSMSSSDRYYLFYLRIQIINKMERHLSSQKLSENRLQEYLNCLHSFMFQASGAEVRSKSEEWVQDFAQKSMLYLIHKRMKIIKQINKQSQASGVIYQILFEYKLKTLRSKFKAKSNSQNFQQFFEQLGLLIRLYKSVKLQSYRNLSAIFNECTTQIKNQLSSIFIQRLTTGEMVFKSQLYEQLIRSKNFQHNIEIFYNQISESGRHPIQHPLQFIKQLWHNYFINLIDFTLEQTSPLIRIPSLKMHSSVHESMPKQLAMFLHDYSLQQSLHIIGEYKSKIELLLKNITPIIKKCNARELESFTQKFNSKIEQLVDKCLEFVRQPGNDKVLGLRKYILLRILSTILQKQIVKVNEKYSLSLQSNCLKNVYQNVEVHKYWVYFMEKAKQYDQQHYIMKALVDFDAFFIGYHQSVQVIYRDIVSQVICEVAMKILNHVQSSTSGRQKQLISYTIQSLKLRKQKVTILQSIVVPYLAERIFKIEMKPISIDKALYNRRFLCKSPEIIIPAKTVQAEADQFEIGEKQEKEEFVKVNNIGKSIINLGNNLITGFIKKK